MSTAYDSTIMGSSPYYNDFDAQKKYLQILFKPGLPVQARELSQAQSILQNQIQRFGTHIFDNGSTVLGGGVSEVAASFVRISSDFKLSTTNLNDMVGQVLRGTRGGVDTDARVVAVSDVSDLVNDDYQVLFIQYLTPGEFIEDQDLSTTGVGNIGITVKTLKDATAPGVGTVSNFISVNEGVFFVDGYFALADKQAFAAYNTHADNYRDYGPSTNSVGLATTKSVVTSETDATLRDPSFGFNNFNAPGADRYKVELSLTQRGLTGSATLGYRVEDPSDYFELARIVDGKTTRKVKYPNYAELEKTLARRTFDESGHYTVEPFSIEIDTHFNTFGTVDSTKFGVILGPGKAYVKGYEYETIANTKLEDTLPTTTFTKTEVTNTTFPSFVTIAPGSGLSIERKLSGLRTDAQQIFLKGQKMGFYSQLGSEYSLLGTFTPIFLTQNEGGSAVRLYISEVETASSAVLNPSLLDAAVASTVIQATDPTGNIILSNDASHFRIKDTTSTESDTSKVVQSGDSKRLIDMTKGGADSTQNPVNLPYVRAFKTSTDVNGSATITLGNGRRFSGILGNKQGAKVSIHALFKIASNATDGARFVEVTNFSLDETNGAITFTLPQGDDSLADISNVPVILFAPVVNIDKTAIRTKVLSGDITASAPIVNNIITLPDADVQSIVSVFDSNDPTTDVSDSFVFDDGQRDSIYEFARLVKKPDAVVGTNFNVTYKRFISSGDDGPYTADSYKTVGKEDVPSFDGKLLTNFVDYRPKRHTSGGIDSVNYSLDPNPDNCNPINQPDDDQIVTYKIIGGRIDSVVLTQDRTFKIIRGVPAVEPVPPAISSNDLELYRIRIPLDYKTVDDIRVEYIDNQRFTMRDIGVIEDTQALDQEFNYRRVLINDTISRANAAAVVPVSASGVFVDEFAGFANSDLSRENFNCSIDPVRNELLPPFVSKSFAASIEETILSGQSSNTIESTDNIVLPTYTNSVFIRETRSGGAAGLESEEQINPFGAVDYYGTLKVTPFCLNYWSEARKTKLFSNPDGQLNNWEFSTTVRRADVIVGRNLGFGTTWRDWELHWFGVNQEEDTDRFIPASDRKYKQGVRSAFVRRILSRRVIKRVKNKIVDVSIRPYIPGTTITLSAEGLKPGATVYAFFDDKSVGETSGYTVDSDGKVTASVTLAADTYPVGRKKVILMDNIDGNVGSATTSADSFFYAEGLFDTRINNLNHIRPPIIKRKSSNSEIVDFDSYEELFDADETIVLNSLTPLMQRFSVRPEAYPNGMFLTKLDLFFKGQAEAGTPVIVSISPVYDGVPVTSINLPFSEKVITTSQATFDTTLSLVGGATTVTFDTPVYLPTAQDYVIKLQSNDLDVSCYVRSDLSAETNSLGPLYLPQNNGTNVANIDKHLNVVLYNAAFDTDTISRGVINVSNDAFVADTLYLRNNPNINSEFTNTVTLGAETLRENSTNFTNTFSTPQRDFDANLDIEFELEKTALMSSVIDGQQVSLLSSAVQLNDAKAGAAFYEITSELEAVDANAPGIARYYSKIIELDENEPADDLILFVDGDFPSSGNFKLYAYFKPLGIDYSENLEDASYFQMFIDDKATEDTAPSGRQNLLFRAYRSGAAPPDSNIPSILSDSGELRQFNKYLIKLVLSHDSGGLEAGETIPQISFIGAAPLKTGSGVGLIPSGTITPYASIDTVNAPVGYLFCDGSVYNNTDYPTLARRLGNAYGGDAATNTFAVPDLRGRLPIGTANNVTGVDDRTLGSTGGSNKLQGHRHHLISESGSGGATGRTFTGRGANGPFNRSIAASSSEVGGSANDKYRLGSQEGFPDATKAVSSNPINSDSLNAETAESISDDTLTEQMPPFVVTNYIIKI